MKADCCSCSCPQNFSQGHDFLVAIKRESVTTFFWKKVSSMSRSIIWNAGVKTVILLSVGSNLHQDAKIPYISNDSFTSSTNFIREDYRFGVSISNLDSRWKQTVFSGSCLQKVSPGHEFLIAIKREFLTIFVWKKIQFYLSFDYLECRR